MKETKFSSGYTNWGVPGPVVPPRVESHLSDERLSEIEAQHESLPDNFGREATMASGGALWCYACQKPAPCVVASLIAEVRRLRRENHLLNLSRGTPSPLVEGD